MKHWKFGGSTATRTVNCPSWRARADTLALPTTTSDAAKLGTALHVAFELYVSQPTTPLTAAEVQEMADYAGISYGDMWDKITEKVAPAVKKLLYELPPEWEIECEAEVPHPDVATIGGTSDIIAQFPAENAVAVVDFKTGDGAEVNDFGQLALYAYLWRLNFPTAWDDGTVFRLVILHAYRGENLWKEEFWSAEEVNRWGMQHEDAVNMADRPTALDGIPPIAGDWCRFCPAMSICPAKTGLVTKALSMEIADSLGDALRVADEMEAWIKSVRSTAHTLIEEGQHIEGYKLVAKRASRKWLSIDAAIDKAVANMPHDGLAPRMPLTPAQMEKACKQKGVDYESVFADNVTSISSGSTLVPESDRRRPILNIKSIKAAIGKTIK